jgi:hypothetical protein
MKLSFDRDPWGGDYRVKREGAVIGWVTFDGYEWFAHCKEGGCWCHMPPYRTRQEAAESLVPAVRR